MRFLKNAIILTLFIYFANVNSNAQFTTPIPLNNKIEHDTLSNGMHYYILHNEETKNKVSFYLVQNIGSILEDDQEIGFAQIIEQMAYKGLEHYPDTSWIQLFEKEGMHLGSDINSYTSQDETIYNLKNIPSTKETILDSALLIMYDWSSGGLLWRDKDLREVRNQINKKWKKSNTPEFHSIKKVMSSNYNQSKYTERNIMQDIDSIPEFKKKDILNFYHKWYHPNLQSLVIVGDIDPNKMEEKVKKLFSNIPQIKKQPQRNYFPIENSNEMSYTIAKIDGAQNSNISWVFRKDPVTVKDEIYLRKQLTLAMMKTLFNNRLKKVSETPDCNAMGMNFSFLELGRIKNATFLSITPKDNRNKDAFSTFMTELERAFKYGFTESELKNVQNLYLDRYESYLDEKDRISNDTWAGEIEDYILKAEPLPDVLWETNFAKKTIPNISLKEINQQLECFKQMENSSLSITGPNKDNIIYPTKEEITTIIKDVKNSTLDPWKNTLDNDIDIHDDLYNAKITGTSTIAETNAQLYLLENGARVVFLPTDNHKNEILFHAYSFGGVSVVPIENLASANLTTMLAIISGAGDFDGIELQKKLGDRKVYVSPYLEAYTEGFKGSTSTHDFETLLKLIYLKFEHPRFDSITYQSIVSNLKDRLAPSLKNKDKAFTDTISMVNYNYNPRNLIFNEEFVDNLNFKKAQNVYLDRFKDAADFTFIFVGNLNPARDLPLVQKYIGSLSSVHRSEKWVNNNMKPAKSFTHKTFFKEMDTPQTSDYYAIYKNIPYNLYNKTLVHIIADYLNKRFNELFIEMADNNDQISVSPKCEKIPYEHSSISITYHCAPDKQDTIAKIVKNEIQKIIENGPISNYLEALKTNYIKKRISSENNNSFWLNAVTSSLMYNEDFKTSKSYTEMINNISISDVQKFAKKLFKSNTVVEVEMKPLESTN